MGNGVRMKTCCVHVSSRDVLHSRLCSVRNRAQGRLSKLSPVYEYRSSRHNEALWLAVSLGLWDVCLDLPVCYALLHLTSFIFKKLEKSSITFGKKIKFNLKWSKIFLSWERWKVTLGLPLRSSGSICGGGVFRHNMLVVAVEEEERWRLGWRAGNIKQ